MKKEWLLLITLLACRVLHAQDTAVQQPKQTKPEWSGSVGVNTTLYGVYGMPNRSNPFTWSVNADINLKVNESIDIPFNLTVGKYQTAFTRPYFQFGMSPRYKWATLHLGNTNMTFNPYTLAGYSFLGAGLEMNPGKFRFAAMYGRLNKAEEIDTTGKSTAAPAFKRMGYGVKVGWGSNENFVDLLYFHAKDDSNSISSWKDPDIVEYLGDAGVISPQENNVIGISSRLRLLKKISFNLDAGLSFYNTNLRKNIDQPKKGIDISGDPVKQYAGKAGLGYHFTNFSLRAEYERILPGYVTLGSYFFNTDIENITLTPSGSFDKGRGNFSISAGLQKNNLDHTKKETTKRFIANANIAYNPSEKWSLSLVYNNFYITQVRGTEAINDSTRIRQINQTFTFTPSCTISRDSMRTHNLGLTVSYNDVNDRNIITRKYGNMKAAMLSLNHSSGFTRSSNTINSGLNFNQTRLSEVINTQYGATVGYTQGFFRQTLTAAININFNMSYVNHTADGNITNASATAAYQLKTRHSFSFACSFIRSNSRQYDSYSEITGSLSYQFRLK